MQTQPSEMIERVARAIVAELEEQQFGTESAWHDPEFRDNAFRCAAAAIAAMREPTAARSQWRPIDEHTPRHGNYARVWVEEGLLYAPHDGEATHWMPLEPPEDSPA